MLSWLLKLRFKKLLKNSSYHYAAKLHGEDVIGQLTNHSTLNKNNKDCNVHITARIISPEKIKLGKGTFIGAQAFLHGGGMQWSNGKGLIQTGDEVEISPRCIIYGAGEVIIGDKTILGPEVKIMAQSESSFHNPQETSQLVFEPVNIGKGCYLGVGSVILGGTELGDNCIVAPNSVIKGKYPANTTLVGNPARVIPRLT